MPWRRGTARAAARAAPHRRARHVARRGAPRRAVTATRRRRGARSPPPYATARRRRGTPPRHAPHTVWQDFSNTMLENIATQPASAQDPPPHPVSLYTFKAPNGVGVPAPHFYRALRFQRHTGGFQRFIFIAHYGSSAKLVDSSAPFLSSLTVPAPHWWIPAPHFYRASRFQRQTGGFQRPIDELLARKSERLGH